MKEDFLSVVDGNLEKLGFGDRAQFIRAAVYEKLRASDVDVEKILSTPPSRAGKGGRRAKVIEIPWDVSRVAETPGETPLAYPTKPTTYPKGKRPRNKK